MGVGVKFTALQTARRCPRGVGAWRHALPALAGVRRSADSTGLHPGRFDSTPYVLRKKVVYAPYALTQLERPSRYFSPKKACGNRNTFSGRCSAGSVRTEPRGALRRTLACYKIPILRCPHIVRDRTQDASFDTRNSQNVD